MDDSDKILEELILAGAVEVSAMDAVTGEILYSFTDKIQDVYPEIHKATQRQFHDDMMFLWQSGFLNMDVAAVNPLVTLTDLAFNEEAISKLSAGHRQTLQIIINALRID